jgi:hypothetical protein
MMKAIYFIIFLFISSPAFSQLSFDPPEEALIIYPNPAKSTLWIKIDNKEIATKDLSVYNIIGDKLNLSPEKEEDGKFSIDVEGLPAGYYLLVVENKSQQFTKTLKFIKK